MRVYSAGATGAISKYRITGNIISSADAGIELDTATENLTDVIISGNIITATDEGIDVRDDSTGEVHRMSISDNQFLSCTNGIKLQGTNCADYNLKDNRFSGCTTDISLFAGATDGIATGNTNGLAPVGAMSGPEVFKLGYGEIFFRDPDGSARDFNPSGEFPAGFKIDLINTATVPETITFDSTSLNQAVAQNERLRAGYTGTAWLVLNLY